MNTETIDMTGKRVGNLDVIEYAPGIGKSAHWWCVCRLCGHQQPVRGFNLRKVERVPGWRLPCRECGE